MKLNNNGWGMMVFLVFLFIILMIILVVAGQINEVPID